MTATDPTPKPAKAAPAAPTTASEPPKPETMSSGYSLPVALHEELREAAKARGLSASYLVQKALEDYLPRLIPVEELALVRPVASVPPSAAEVVDAEMARMPNSPQA